MGLQINSQDVVAIAKARVTRAYSKATNYWYYGLIAACFIGVLLFRVTSIAGWVVIIGAVIGFAWYSVKLTRKQNLAAKKLLKEWQETENNQEVG